MTRGRQRTLPTSVAQFGKRVAELRDERRMTQLDLALATGIDRSVVGLIERGEREVGISKVPLIAAALEVEPNDLFAV